MRYYPRDIEPVLKRAVGQFRVVVLTGARQTGKSTLLQRLFKDAYTYVTLDNPRDLGLAQEDPERFFEKYRFPLIIDEIQYAPKLLSSIKVQVDREQKRGMFLLTGSQQFTMMQGLQETLAGRAVLFQLLPMALGEGNISTRTYSFRGFVGSYPELVTGSKLDSSERWYGSYLSTYIERDVQPYYRLEKVTYFRDFLFLLAARAAQILNYQSLSSDLGVSVSAVKLWLRILEASHLIYLLRPYYVNLGSRITKSPKVYFTDTGLLNFLLGNRDKRALMEGPRGGVFFENFVIQEVLKSYFHRGRLPALFYYRTNNGLEVDLILEEGAGRIRPCEIKLTQSPRPEVLTPIRRLRGLNQKHKVSILEGSLICLANGVFPMTKEDTAYGIREFLKTLQ